ncbi:hypothetical protein KSP39_PZI012941 [Platanthera zijinensis]|uniref:Toc75-like POTRA domain-containing protein n=1 Tax=Platanthera zijinensis TaxID=2320716 RepID=A0AAP0BDH7_9ASPA
MVQPGGVVGEIWSQRDLWLCTVGSAIGECVVLQTGHVFNIEDGKQALRNINSLAMFSNIEVNPRPDEKNEGGIIVEIKLKELEQKPVEASIQPGGTVTFEHRNIKGLDRSILGSVTLSNLLNPQIEQCTTAPISREELWKVDELSSQESRNVERVSKGRDDILASILGKEHLGMVRASGKFLTIKSYFKDDWQS